MSPRRAALIPSPIVVKGLFLVPRVPVPMVVALAGSWT